VPFRLVFKRPNGEELNVVQAAVGDPDTVQELLTAAIVEAFKTPSDITLLEITIAFIFALRTAFEEFRPLRLVLEAARQGYFGHHTERIFYASGLEQGLVCLGLLSRYMPEFVQEIDSLPESEAIKLARLVTHIPRHSAVRDFVDCFLESECKMMMFLFPFAPCPLQFVC
jgi:hypothetical protein